MMSTQFPIIPPSVGQNGLQRIVQSFHTRLLRLERGRSVPFASFRRTAGNQTVPASTELSVTFDTFEVQGGMSSESSRFIVIPEAGLYDLRGGVQTASHAAGRLYLTFGFGSPTVPADGTPAYTGTNDALFDLTTSTTSGPGGAISMYRNLSVGDRVALRVMSSIATSIGPNFIFFQARKVE